MYNPVRFRKQHSGTLQLKKQKKLNNAFQLAVDDHTK